jgi:class 3 adenylate cyclase
MHDQYSQASTASIPPGKIPTGTITFLFTDIEGSTQLWEKFPEQMAAELRRHNTLLRQAIEAHGGYVFKTVGDQFCAAFANAYDALSAAIEVQRALINEPWDGPDIKVRIGIHCGPAEEWAGDYFGPTVNRVARLMAIGHGGQTLLSASVLQLVDDEIPSEIAVQDLGERSISTVWRMISRP